MCHVSLQLYAQYPALNCCFFSWAHFFVFSKHICSPIKPLKSSQHINHNWDFFKKILAIFQTSRIRTKSLLQVMQLQRKNLLGSAKNAVIFMYVCEISTKQPVNMLLGSQHPLSIWFVCISPLYSAWGAGAACDHSQEKDGSLTLIYETVKYTPQYSFKLGCRTVIQNPF